MYKKEYKETYINKDLRLIEQYGYKFYICRKKKDNVMYACTWALLPIELFGKCCYNECSNFKEKYWVEKCLKNIKEKHNKFGKDFWVAEVVKMCGKIVPRGVTIEQAKILDCSIPYINDDDLDNDDIIDTLFERDKKQTSENKKGSAKHSKILLPDYTLTKSQQQAINIAYSNIKSNKQITTIAGYAGTGKSTIILFLIDKLAELDIYLEDVAFCTFTGKAARVLTNKGTPAITIHKLIYNPVVNKKTGEVTFVLKDNLDCKLVVIDECSMLPKKMLNELLKFGVPCVFTGDPFQLPPIDESEDNHLLDKPDIFLTEVMRQAKDSGIIQLATLIREGKDYKNFTSKDAIVISKDELTNKYLKNADIILTATNIKRNSINKKMRRLLNREGVIDNDEKLICCKNYWETTIEKSCTNGLIGKLKDFKIVKSKIGIYNIPSAVGTFESEDGLNKFIKVDINFLQTEEPSLNQKQCLRLDLRDREKIPKQFTYAYAITGHKAQGSEWDKVIIFEEDFPFVDHNRWLYTCITRAKQKVILVHK